MRDRYQLLADLLVGRPPASLAADETEWSELLALAAAERVGPLLQQALHSGPPVVLPSTISTALESFYRQAAFASLGYCAARERICRRMGQGGIPVLLLKGAALALTCYSDPATRPMVDLDLLVPRSRVEEAVSCLEEGGFGPRSGSFATQLRSPRGHLVAVHAATQAVVELHWDLKLLGRVRARALSEIWAGAQPAGTEDRALVMRLGHTLPLLCTHMLLQHRECRLLWLYDIHRVLRAMDAAEAALASNTARRWRLGPCTALALLRVRELFGTELPGELSAWAEEVARGDGLQARVAAQALARNPEAPSEYLMSLLMNRNYSLRSILVPPPEDLRQRLGLDAEARVGITTYVAFLSRRLRNGPLHFRQLWRFWRANAPPPCSRE